RRYGTIFPKQSHPPWGWAPMFATGGAHLRRVRHDACTEQSQPRALDLPGNRLHYLARPPWERAPTPATRKAHPMTTQTTSPAAPTSNPATAPSYINPATLLQRSI